MCNLDHLFCEKGYELQIILTISVTVNNCVFKSLLILAQAMVLGVSPCEREVFLQGCHTKHPQEDSNGGLANILVDS